jgi:trk system potassium uptake protein
MLIVIAGYGIIGNSLAEEFSSQNHDVVVIDYVNANDERMGCSFDGRIIKCLEIDNTALLKAGISEADIFLAATSDDTSNIMLSQIAKNIHGVDRVIALNVDPSCESKYSMLGIEFISQAKLVVNAVMSRVSGRSLL